jgi:hypothetical protein
MTLIQKQILSALLLMSIFFSLPMTVMAQANNRYYTTYPNQSGTYQVYSAQSRINPEVNDGYYSQTQTASTTYVNSDPHPYRTRFRRTAHDVWGDNSAKKTASGALIGLGAAALKGRNLLHGTVVGLAAGAGFGLLDESHYFSAHPLGRRVAKGAIVGVAAASATGAAALLPALGLGAAVGAGVHAINKL